MSSSLIESRDFRVGYDGTEVLHGIDVAISEGEFVSIVGKSGCGKSTFLLALAGFIPSRGFRRVPDDIGMVFQNYAAFPWMSVRENVGFGLPKLGPKERGAVVARNLEMVGLTPHADKYPGQLSGGQVQRVALARALAPDPTVVFMDEPFGALDNFTRTSMQEWLQSLRQRDNKTVLFVTHNIEESIFLADRILLFGDGRIIDDFAIGFERPRPANIKFASEFVNLRRTLVERLSRTESIPADA